MSEQPNNSKQPSGLFAVPWFGYAAICVANMFFSNGMSGLPFLAGTRVGTNFESLAMLSVLAGGTSGLIGLTIWVLSKLLNKPHALALKRHQWIAGGLAGLGIAMIASSNLSNNRVITSGRSRADNGLGKMGWQLYPIPSSPLAISAPGDMERPNGFEASSLVLFRRFPDYSVSVVAENKSAVAEVTLSEFASNLASEYVSENAGAEEVDFIDQRSNSTQRIRRTFRLRAGPTRYIAILESRELPDHFVQFWYLSEEELLSETKPDFDEIVESVTTNGG